MAVTTFAAIDVGSHETSLRIYEISKKNGVNQLEYLHHASRLGYEAYANDHISYRSVENLCEILNGFSLKLKEYAVKDCTIIATSAMREADNNLIVLDQVRQRTGFSINILSNAEQRYLCYKAIALTPNSFHRLIQKGTLLVDVGGGSIQLSLFDKSALIATQNIMLGSLRIQEFLQSMRNTTDNYLNLIEEYIAHDLHVFTDLYLKNYKVKNIIAVGNQLPNFLQYLSNHNLGKPVPLNARGTKTDSISKAEYDEFFADIITQRTDAISRALNISLERAELLMPTVMIYHILFAETKAEQMWLSGLTLCDGMAADFAEKKAHIVPAHSFFDDILSAAHKVAERYGCDQKHNAVVTQAALKIFDAVKKQNNLTGQDRLLLQIAAILHNCGEYINLRDVGENSYKIISSTEIIGISRKQQLMVASVVRYPTEGFPQYGQMTDLFEQEEYITIAKLNAILRLADSLDKSHKQKFSHLNVLLRNQTLHVTGHTLYDIALESGMFANDADFFEEMFGVKPVLKQKKDF